MITAPTITGETPHVLARSADATTIRSEEMTTTAMPPRRRMRSIVNGALCWEVSAWQPRAWSGHYCVLAGAKSASDLEVEVAGRHIHVEGTA